MKIKVTKASKKDHNKVTIRSSEFGFAGVFLPGAQIIAPFKGTNGKVHNIVLKASRNGETFYGDCPRDLQMPSVGKPKIYELIAVPMVVPYV